MNNPAQMAQMLQALTPAQRAEMAAAMGVSPQQLAQVKCTGDFEHVEMVLELSSGMSE